MDCEGSENLLKIQGANRDAKIYTKLQNIDTHRNASIQGEMNRHLASTAQNCHSSPANCNAIHFQKCPISGS